jgi:multisubunit Na+/H+ antiporter MnhG subunit
MDTQTLINILLDMGNIVMFIGTLLLIRSVLKNRNVLKGYDPIGSLLTMIGMLLFDAFYVVIGNEFSLVIASFTTAYWILTSVYSIKIATAQLRVRLRERYWQLRVRIADLKDYIVYHLKHY